MTLSTTDIGTTTPDGRFLATYDDVTVEWDPTDHSKSKVRGSLPAVILRGGPNLLAVQGVQAAQTIARLAESDEHTVIAWTDAAQLASTTLVLSGAVMETATVVVAADGLVSTSYAAYADARPAVDFLTGLTMSKTRAIHSPAIGWPEYEQSRPTAGLLATWMSNAKPLTSRPPARTKSDAVSTIAPAVDDKAGLVVQRTMDGARTLMTAAPLVVRSVLVVEDNYGERIETVRVDLRLIVGEEGSPERAEQTILAIRECDLETVRGKGGWLTKAPGIAAGVVIDPTQTGVEKMIGQAVRAQIDARPRYRARARTGWDKTEEGHGWLHSAGVVTADGNRLKDDPEEALTWAELPLDHTIDLPHCTVAAPALLHVREMWGMVADPAITATLLGSALFAAAGLAGRSGVGAVPFLLAQFGSGKTTLIGALNGMLSRRWASQPMFKVDRSAASERHIGVPFEDCWLTVDDARDGQSDRRATEQTEALENLTRRGFERGAGRAVSRQRDGEWESGLPPQTAPLVVLSGELVPDAEDRKSSVDRLIVQHLRKGEVLASGDFARLRGMAEDPLTQEAFVAYLMWVAGQIDRCGNLQTWVEKREAQTVADFTRRFLDKLGGTESMKRAASVLAVPLTGIQLWLECLLDHGIVDEATITDEIQKTAASLIKTMKAQHATYLGADEGGTTVGVLSRLREMEIAGLVVTLGGMAPLHWRGGPRVPETVAALGEHDGEDVVMINVAAAARALAGVGRDSKSLESEIWRELETVAIPDKAGRRGHPRRWKVLGGDGMTTVGGQIRVALVPVAAWDPSGETASNLAEAKRKKAAPAQ